MTDSSALADFSKSGIFRIYAIVTVLSIIVISIVTGSLGIGGFVGGWIGLIAAIAVNELTAGYTMENHWISGRGSK